MSVSVERVETQALDRKPSPLRRVLTTIFALVVTLGFVAGLVGLGRATGWRLPKASALRGETRVEFDDWCEEHGVPESTCVECNADLLPRGLAYGWCKIHGISECPLCHPEVAQLATVQVVTDAEREVAARSLAFAPRTDNDSKCKKHLRRIQLASDEMATRLGLTFTQVGRGRIEDVIRVPGEVVHDPTRIARVAPRSAGTVWRVERLAGQKVRRGDLLALIDSAEVGKAKAEFQQALVQLDLRSETLAKLRPMAGTTVAVKDVQAAAAAVEEAEVRLFSAEETLDSLGLPLKAGDVLGLKPADLATRLQFLGLPEVLGKELTDRVTSSNLLPIIAPLDGFVVSAWAVKDEAADPAKPMFVVADTGKMRLTIHVRPDDAERIKPGQPVRFQHAGHTGRNKWDSGTVVWVSPTADEKTRTVPIRVDLPNPSDRHAANTFGTAEVVLREEPNAVVVPGGAVHWDGCCHVVFVRDRDYEKSGSPKVVHVRKVRPGAENVAATGPMTEIVAGLLPGEWVAVTNSGVFRSELLKYDLGAG